MANTPVQIKRWSRHEYDRLVEVGIFRPGDPVELLAGNLIVAEPQGTRHVTAVRRATRALEAAFGLGWEVRPQAPFALDDESEPEPDLAVVPGAIEDYRDAHPSRAALVVEVAESSLALDRQHKASLYARAGLADYWIVNLVDRVLEVYRQPVADPASPFGWRYASLRVLQASARVTPLATPTAVLVADLLP
jgi:Uma2 family endonuclease